MTNWENISQLISSLFD